MKLKKTCLATLSLLSILGMAACGNASSGVQESYPEVIDVARETQYKEVYSSFTIDTDNVKKTYYLGDTFDTTGLVVKKNYLSYDSNNKLVDIPAKSYETKEYSIDSSEVDMLKVGTYPVYVTCRVGTITNTLTYQVTVKSSVFESTPGLSFISGIDVTYTDGTTLKTFTKNDQISLNQSNLTVSVHEKTINQDLTFADAVINYDVSKLTFDFSKIDSHTVGSQMIKVTYDGGTKTIAGQNYENKVTSYVLVNVKNDALSIKAGGNNTDVFKATLEDLDFSSWKVAITREVDTEIVDFSYDLFDIENMDPFYWNKTQTISVVLKENPTLKYFPKIYIEESETFNITKYFDLKPNGAEKLTSDGKNYSLEDVTIVDGSVNIGGTDFISVKLPEKDADRTKFFTLRTTDKYGSQTFSTRFTIKGSGQPIQINMAKPGSIVVFFATTGDEERELSLLNAEKEEIDAATSTSTKQQICKYIFECSSAGTYYIVNPSGGMYIHGLVIATSK